MSTDTTSGAAQPASVILPPYLIIRDFLGQAEADALLDYAIDHEQAFEPTKVGRNSGAVIAPNARISLAIREMGEFSALLRERVAGRLDQLAAELRVAPPQKPRYEFQLVAHGDGAFYQRHIDTRTGLDGRYIRVLSAVYYAHRRPRAFEGGELRLHNFVPTLDGHVDLSPDHNTLVIFPSWAPHEVMPIRCPSGRFADARFAVNIWVYGERPSQMGDSSTAANPPASPRSPPHSPA